MLRISTLLLLCSLIIRAQGPIPTFAGTDWLFPVHERIPLQAPLGSVTGVAQNRSGDIYFTDPDNHMAFRLSPAGSLEVVAGTGLRGFSGDGGAGCVYAHPVGNRRRPPRQRLRI